MSTLLQEIIDQSDASFGGLVDDLRSFVGIPSISGSAEHLDDIQHAVQWIKKRLSGLSLDRLVVFETTSNPILYAEIKSDEPGMPTVLIYGHYDVQPAVAINDWKTDPFKAEIKGDYLYGRGASDMKGQVLAYISAIEAILKSGSFPINIKLLLEGDEEVDPEPLAEFLRENAELLTCDFSLNCDAMLIGINEPTIVYGLRGGTECTLEIVGPATDIHGGLNAGVIENPIHVLSRLLAGLLDEAGQVTLPGFFEKVREMEPEERAELARLPLNDEYYKRISGAPAITGEAEFLPVERTGARPAVNVSMFSGGSEKGSIPSTAVANISFLLVPDQDPEEI
jgi:acetylornithine deacetylase/succinyl-diaminopimelate desuccinylase-like protein